MCGLVFLYSNNQNDHTHINNSIDCLCHRGPDERGKLHLKNASLGHARLSIIDLENNHQPMQSPDGRYALVYNGEIYNYIDLRRRLVPYWDFRTNGDTEVLLAGLILEGEHFINRLEGMWSLTLWDNFKHELFLSRDRMGKKPLYYRQFRNYIACASELNSLKSLSPNNWNTDLNYIADYFRFGFGMPGYTAYKGVYEIPPGHSATWSPPHELQIRQYWHLSNLTSTLDKTSTYEHLTESLYSAVNKRLVADVEVGSFLSGGVDSSLITAIAQKNHEKCLKTFTIGFKDQNFDESYYANLASDYIGTDHYQKVLESLDYNELIKLINENVGQPFADPSLLPTALVSKTASDHVKVVLSGDGGDELFGGYQRYQARMIMRWYTRLPSKLRRFVHSGISKLPVPMAHHSRSLLKKAHLFLETFSRQSGETPYFAPTFFTPEQYKQLFPSLTAYGHSPPNIPEETGLDDIQRMMLSDALIYLPQDILLKVDRASMAYGLEVRAPFLDHKLVELAFSIPYQQHLRIGQGKLMLYKAFSEHIPKILWARRKQGFAVPVHDWLRGKLGESLRDMLNASDGLMNAKPVLELLDEHQSYKRDHSNRLWSIYTYLIWANKT